MGCHQHIFAFTIEGQSLKLQIIIIVMDSTSFAACINTSSSLRKSCSSLFKVPSSFQFNDEDGVFFLHGDSLSYSEVHNFHCGSDGGSWVKFFSDSEKRPLSRCC